MEPLERLGRGDEIQPAPMVAAGQESGVRRRIDPRTGKVLTLHGAAFWREHDTERRRRGESVVDYCAAHDLALSTFRRWASRFNQEAHGSRAASETASNGVGFLALPIHNAPASSGEALVEVVLDDGVSVKLGGAPALRVIDTVLARLGAAR